MKLIVKQILCIKLVKYWAIYTEMHGQQNVKVSIAVFAVTNNPLKLDMWYIYGGTSQIAYVNIIYCNLHTFLNLRNNYFLEGPAVMKWNLRTVGVRY